MFTKKQHFLSEEEWVMYKDEEGETVPAIVSEELWEAANRVYRMRSKMVKGLFGIVPLGTDDHNEHKVYFNALRKEEFRLWLEIE